WKAPGNRTSYCIDADSHIPGLDGLLAAPTVDLSRLVWLTLCEQEDESWFTARYRNNSSYPVRTAPSQLVCVLRSRAWVPQTNGRFVRPCEATRELLQSGFPFDPGWAWLAELEFGKQITERNEEQVQLQELARDLGFEDNDALERAKRFVALPAD